MSLEMRKFLAALQTKASVQQAPLCRLHQQTGFADGFQFGIRLTQELNTS